MWNFQKKVQNLHFPATLMHSLYPGDSSQPCYVGIGGLALIATLHTKQEWAYKDQEEE